MSTAEKKQVIIRMYPDDIAKIHERLKEDGLSFQKFSEVLFSAYLRGNKEILKLIAKRVEEKVNKRETGGLDDTEREELFRRIEKEYSPLKDLDEAMQEIDDEEE
jgi:predicted DNA binding CopG/RHH family protein